VVAPGRAERERDREERHDREHEDDREHDRSREEPAQQPIDPDAVARVIGGLGAPAAIEVAAAFEPAVERDGRVRA
jgi:hypothetical protein